MPAAPDINEGHGHGAQIDGQWVETGGPMPASPPVRALPGRPAPPFPPPERAPAAHDPADGYDGREDDYGGREDDYDDYEDYDDYDPQDGYDDREGGYGPEAGYDERPVLPGIRLNRSRLLMVAAIVTVLAITAGGIAGWLVQPAANWQAGVRVGNAAPALAQLGGDAPRPSPGGLAGQLHTLLQDPRLGDHVTASVVDVNSGDALFDLDGSAPSIPASTTKLLTATAVLTVRGPTYRIPTRVVAGPNPGEVVLVGGGDPTLSAGAKGTYPEAGRLDELAAQVKKALGDQAPTKVLVDSSLFSGPTAGPGWSASDLTGGYITNITALMTDGARRNPRQVHGAADRYSRPDLAAGKIFAKLLDVPASAVSLAPGAGAGGGRQLGEVLSPPLIRIIETMLLESDNVVAEMLARQVAIARHEPASFAGAAQATREVLSGLGIPVDGFGLVDGSGMSHLDHLDTRLLASVLAHDASPDHPQLRAVLSGLPVAGYSGTLTDRYRRAGDGGAAAGSVRAKTGTLSAVSSLAGVVVDADGRMLAFAIMANGVENSYQGTLRAEAALDRVAASIAACGCQ